MMAQCGKGQKEAGIASGVRIKEMVSSRCVQFPVLVSRNVLEVWVWIASFYYKELDGSGTILLQ